MKKQQLESNGWLYLEPVYEFNDDYKAGIIIAQSKKAGEAFASGSTLEVTVSKGPSSIKLPEYEGKTLQQYEDELRELGLTNYNTEAVVNYKYKNNEVIELNKDAGEVFDLTGAETLKIFYASNPETTPSTEVQFLNPVEPEDETDEPEAPTLPPIDDSPAEVVDEVPPAPIVDDAPLVE